MTQIWFKPELSFHTEQTQSWGSVWNMCLHLLHTRTCTRRGTFCRASGSALSIYSCHFCPECVGEGRNNTLHVFWIYGVCSCSFLTVLIAWSLRGEPAWQLPYPCPCSLTCCRSQVTHPAVHPRQWWMSPPGHNSWWRINRRANISTGMVNSLSLSPQTRLFQTESDISCVSIQSSRLSSAAVFLFPGKSTVTYSKCLSC